MSKANGLSSSNATGAAEVLKEITKWPDGTINHTYLVEKTKGWLVGYRNAVTGKVDIFEQPMKQFSKTRRKFKKVVDAKLSFAYNNRY